MTHYLSIYIANRPSAGWVSSGLASFLGVANIMQQVQGWLGIVSLTLGIYIACLTIQALHSSRRERRRLEAERLATERDAALRGACKAVNDLKNGKLK